MPGWQKEVIPLARGTSAPIITWVQCKKSMNHLRLLDHLHAEPDTMTNHAAGICSSSGQHRPPPGRSEGAPFCVSAPGPTAPLLLIHQQGTECPYAPASHGFSASLSLFRDVAEYCTLSHGNQPLNSFKIEQAQCGCKQAGQCLASELNLRRQATSKAASGRLIISEPASGGHTHCTS